ncbi:MAG: T9SS type A sorting domain-containing protein [Chitinophagales bacterium]|nr:T9SS type A sorting domain-containing protein [Chitinophagales bacterium]
MIKNTLLILLIALLQAGFSQTYQPTYNIDFIDNGVQKKFPLVGGLSYIQIANVDVNNNGIEDLVVYDVYSNRIEVFRNSGINNSIHYTYDTIDYGFPNNLGGWVLFEDYNCDGIKDLFTANQEEGSISVYKGYYSNNKMNYTLSYYKLNTLSISGNINLYNISIDKPAIYDVDQDGDLDILSFNTSGTRIVYYKNQSVELNLPCDSLQYKTNDFCWGNISEGTSSSVITFRDTCDGKFLRIANPNNIKHAGSSITLKDLNNDGLADLLLSDASYNNINLTYNVESHDYASFLSLTNDFPTANQKVDIASLPNVNFVDINNDTEEDMVVANFSDYLINKDNIWYYQKNNTSNTLDFTLQNKNFLLEDIVDVGNNSYPLFLDYNNDGLQDILIASGGIKSTNEVNSTYKIKLYKNIGSIIQPIYNLVNDDYLNISTLQLTEISPCLGDIDNDGDDDLIIGTTNIIDGLIFWWENTANANEAPIFTYRNILLKNSNNQIEKVGSSPKPSVYDLNNDNLNDLIIGISAGRLLYYQANNNNLSFTKISDTLSGIDVRNTSISQYAGFAYPTFADIDNNGITDLVLGSYYNGVQIYYDYLLHYTNNNLQADAVINNKNIERSTPTCIDLNNDQQMEILIGNKVGGLLCYSTTPNLFINTFEDKRIPTIFVYPNPATDYISIHNNININSYEIFDILGKNWKSATSIFQNKININLLPKACYIIQITDINQNKYLAKFIKQ